MKKLALFDIDGVVYEGHSIFDLIQDQEKSGFIKVGLWNQILDLLTKYKIGELAYTEAANGMLDLYAKSLQGKKYSEILEYNLDFVKRSKDKIFPYFEDLIPELQKTHDIHLVSTNFDFTVEAFVKHFNLGGFLSTKIAQDNGVVSDKIELSLSGNKGIVEELIAKYGKEGSIAVGDSENDADMLNKVDLPLVMEPNEKLQIIAKENNWQIVDRNTIADIILKHAK